MEETLLENYMSLKCCSNFCLKIDFVNFPFGWENSTSRKVIQTLKGILLKIMVSQVSSCHTTVLMKNKSCFTLGSFPLYFVKFHWVYQLISTAVRKTYTQVKSALDSYQIFSSQKWLCHCSHIDSELIRIRMMKA